mmetsp:Transcript_25200/g.72610  ORF Transcript_25200/g.72610 Transcript_25200/m.72610 type:complete len:230 (-) Transcript_25200:293-982(-)
MQPSPGARFASEEHRDRGPDLLAGLEEQQGRVHVVDPLRGDDAGSGSEHDDLDVRAARSLPDAAHEVLRLRQREVRAVPTLLRVRRNANHRDVGALGGGAVVAVDHLDRRGALLEVRHHALQRVDGARRHHEAATPAGVHRALQEPLVVGVVAVLADERDFPDGGGQGQSRTLVLEENGAVDECVPGDCVVLVAGGGDVQQGPARIDGEAALEVPGEIHRREDVGGLEV